MNILVTGATGTLGTEVLKQLNKMGYKDSVIGTTRQEKKLYELEKYCTPLLCDLKDITKFNFEDCDVIFHFAALKHVDLGENYIDEFVETNVNGTKNVLTLQKKFNIPKVVFTSTDKAMYPINAYGMTKALAEKYVLKNSNNVVCRYGNVFGSNGSIFQKLPRILEETNIIPITHYKMTRFFLDVKKAAAFVIKQGLSNNSGICIPQMKSAEICEMFSIAAELLKVEDFMFEEIGLRPGEKIHEDIRPGLSSENSPRFSREELLGLIENEIFANRE